MKIIVFTIIFGLLASSLWAQSKAQVMMQQVADLATSLKTLKDGYSVVDNGLKDIHGIKNGTFGLHRDYFNAQKQVSPAVKNNAKLPVITSDQQSMIQLFQAEISWQKQQAILSNDEIDYLKKVYGNVLSECNADMDELNLVIQPGTQMSDEQRLKRIDKLYGAALDKYRFTQDFVHKCRAFALDRQNDKDQNKIIKKLYDIN